MMKIFNFIALAVVFALTGLQPQWLAAQSIQDHLSTQPEHFTRDQLVGRWRLIATRTGDAAFRESDGSHIFLVTPANARFDEIELHSKKRKWITEKVAPSEDFRFWAQFEYYPEQSEISSAIPAAIRPELEGVLKWTARLDVHHTEASPLLKLTFHPGEVRWEHDRVSGEVTSHEIVGDGEAREFIYAFDPIVSVEREPTQRVEVLSLRSATAPRASGSATPQVMTTIPGQKIYPQAYLDETIAKKRGNRIALTITGEDSGETAEVTLESRGRAREGEMRYGIALSRVSDPLGRAMTLAPTCGANAPYLYPPVLSKQWVDEFFATDALAATREKGTCVPFDGISGETVKFSIGEDVVYRVQWYRRWEDLALAQYRSDATRLRSALVLSPGRDADLALGMMDRFDALMQSDLLTARQKIAVAAVYFAPDNSNEGFPTGLIRKGREAAEEFLRYRQSLSIGSAQVGTFYGLSGTYDWHRLGQLGRQGRDYAASLIAADPRKDPRIDLERLALDEAIMVSSARHLEQIWDTITRDGLHAMYAQFAAVNLVGKVYSMATYEDAFGNPMTDEAYWLNIVDILSEFTMMGATAYNMSAPMRFHSAGSEGKIRRLTDGLGGARGQVFKARMRGGRTGNARHFTARDPSGLSQVIDAFETISDGFPASLRDGQQQQIVVIVKSGGPIGRLLPPPEQPRISVSVAPKVSPRRQTIVVSPADPVTEFGHSAQVAHQAPDVFRPAKPGAPDAVAGNFVIYHQTGRVIDEAQGQAHLTMAMESLSDGQPDVTPGILSFGRTEPVPSSVFGHRMEMQGIEVAHFPADHLNIPTTKRAVDGGWTVEVQIKPQGAEPRRVYVTHVGEDQWGVGAEVDFFDPSRGQVVRMDADEFSALALVDTDHPITTYRARDPMQDGLRTASVDFAAAQIPDAPATPPAPASAPLPGSVTPQANSYFRFQTDAGEQVIALGDQFGKGAINGVYRAAGRDGQVVRISLDKAGNTNHVLNDWWARSFLGDDAINTDVIAPIKLHQRRLIAEGVDQIQVLELVDEFSGTLADTMVKQQGGAMTKGQAAAYVAAAREINAKGGVWMDSHLNNFTFIPTGEDTWKVQIFDPGGIYPIKGETASARAALARQIQTEAWAPDEVYQRLFKGNPNSAEEGFRSALIDKYAPDIAVDDMVIPGAGFAQFDISQGIPANFFVPFKQADVRDAILASQ